MSVLRIALPRSLIIFITVPVRFFICTIVRLAVCLAAIKAAL